MELKDYLTLLFSFLPNWNVPLWAFKEVILIYEVAKFEGLDKTTPHSDERKQNYITSYKLE